MYVNTANRRHSEGCCSSICRGIVEDGRICKPSTRSWRRSVLASADPSALSPECVVPSWTARIKVTVLVLLLVLVLPVLMPMLMLVRALVLAVQCWWRHGACCVVTVFAVVDGVTSLPALQSCQRRNDNAKSSKRPERHARYKRRLIPCRRAIGCGQNAGARLMCFSSRFLLQFGQRHSTRPRLCSFAGLYKHKQPLDRSC